MSKSHEISSSNGEQNKSYNELIHEIQKTVAIQRDKAVRSVNTELLLMNWTIGKYIIEFEQDG